MEEILFVVIIIYLVCHIPAIILLILGLTRLKSRPENAKKLLIAAGIYFIIGGGICGALLT
jgi:arginine exporter protein ArgO